nr:gamma-glutamylcyclotransferase family protein [uncultured Eudoraea sp.]
MAVIEEYSAHRLNATEYLFTYGTLQQEDIQLTVFSRTLSGFSDTLSGYKLSDEKVVGIYPVMQNSDIPTDFVNGRVYMCSNKEILDVDKYEGPAYKRIKVTLNSGKSAWAYISSAPQSN